MLKCFYELITVLNSLNLCYSPPQAENFRFYASEIQFPYIFYFGRVFGEGLRSRIFSKCLIPRGFQEGFRSMILEERGVFSREGFFQVAKLSYAGHNYAENPRVEGFFRI